MGDKDDLTRLEDLSEYIHELNEEVDSQLEDGSKTLDAPPPPPPAVNLDELDDDEEDSSEDSSSDSFAEEDSSFEKDNFNESSDEEDSFPTEEFSSDEFNGGDFSNDQEDFDASDFSSDDFSDDNSDFNDPTEADFQIETEDFETTAQFSSESNDSSSEEGEDTFSITGDNEDENSFETDDTENNFSLDDNDQESKFDTEDNYEDPSEYTEEEIEEESFEELNPIERLTPTPTTVDITQETFKDIRSFAKHISYGQVTRGGEPPFTLLIRNINYLDDVEDIKIQLQEYGLYTEDNASLIDQSLQQGALILPQLSEFAAIFLANKLRRFSGDIQLGLSDEVHPSKGINKKFKGLVSKENLLRNMKRSKKSYKEDFNKDSIILATTPTVEPYMIKEYVGIISSDLTIPEKFFHDHSVEDDNLPIENEITEHQQIMQDFLSQFTIGTTAYYQDLAEDLKSRAYKLGANGIVGITYSITPLMDFHTGSANGQYKILATGSAVLLVARGEQK